MGDALTRPRRALHLYVPTRYFHQPHGSSDASGLGNTSRFLTDDVRSLCEVVHASEPAAALAGEQIHEQIRVGVDALWH